MKKMVWFPVAAVFAALIVTACFKKDDVVQCTPNTMEKDRHIIDSFINDNGLGYVSFNSQLNLYTGIVSPGETNAPGDNTDIAYKYTIKLMNGTTLYTSDSLYRNSQTGINLKPSDFNSASLEYYFFKSVGKKGVMKVIVPSHRGSDCRDQQLQNGIIIPANSQLIYDFTLTGVGTTTP
ncbi:FKBP-type peptidyl-prolyl cis-trans isomerase [Niabella aquatica]